MLQRFPRCNFHASLRAAVTSLAITFMLGLAAQAQTFTVIHSFSGPEGANPQAGLTLDGAGNLYGTSAYGGNTGGECQTFGCGTVFKLTHAGSGWVLSTLHKFNGGDGLVPISRVSLVRMAPSTALPIVVAAALFSACGLLLAFAGPHPACGRKLSSFALASAPAVCPRVTSPLTLPVTSTEPRSRAEITATAAAWDAAQFTS